MTKYFGRIEIHPVVRIAHKVLAFSVKAKRFNKMFTSILALFFLLRIPNKSHFYAPHFIFV